MKRTGKIVRPLRNGQITIPAEFRKELAIGEHSLLEVTLVGSELRVKPVEIAARGRGSAWARDLYELFAPVRAEAAPRSGTEVDADISRAVAAVRRKRARRV